MTLYVDDSGTGAPVIFLHSGGMSGRQWRRLAARVVERGFRAVSPDLTGHGKSPAWTEPRPFSFQTDVDEIVSLVEALPEPAHLVGHSYGGFLALVVALARPTLVRSIAVYDPVAFGTLDPQIDADARMDLDAVREWEPSLQGRERWLEGFVDYWGGPGAWVALREELRAELRRVAWVVSQGVATLGRDETRAATYSSLTIPVLVVSGETTTIAARRVAQRLCESIPRSRHEVIVDAGHMGPLTHPDVVGDLVLAWLAAAAGATNGPAVEPVKD